MKWNGIERETCPCQKANGNKEYRIVVMDADGKVTVGRKFNNWDDLHEAVTELRNLYAKHGVPHQVGYMEI